MDGHLEMAYEDVVAPPCEGPVDDNDGPLDQPDCELCGEEADEDTGEFWDPEIQSGVWAHELCARDAGLEPA